MTPTVSNRGATGSEGPVILAFDTSLSIAHITLNRPKSLNAINASLLMSLVDALKNVKASDVKVCVLSGSGASFCSGEDLKETLAPKSNGEDHDELRVAFHQLQDVTRLIAGVGTIFIACVQGWAVGGGAEIALAADLIISGPRAMFKFPEVVHGHAPTGGITARLPKIVGLLQAKRLMLLGDSISATTALSLNLVTELVNDPLTRAIELATELSHRPKRSLCSIKQCLELATFPNNESVLQAEVDAASWCFADSSSRDAFHNFRNRKAIADKATGVTVERFAATGYNIEAADSKITLVSLLVKASGSGNNRPFLRFGPIDIPYAKFAHDVAHLATGLLRANVQPGDVVAGMMTNSEEMIRAWFATMWIGAIWAPLNTEYRGVILRRALTLISPKVAIIDAGFCSHLPQGIPFQVFVHESPSAPLASFSDLQASTPAQPAETTSRTTACLLLTSGTTGPSKACELSHAYFITVATALISSLNLQPEDVLYCPFPLCHADATSLTVTPALLLGATAAISRRFSASRWWDEIRQTRATVADFMGATLSILYKAPPRSSDVINPLRLMWGVPVPVWADQFEARFGLKIIEVYGSTETGLPIVQPAHDRRILGSCGVALPNVKLTIRDGTGEVAPPGIIGEIVIWQAPYTRFTGYYNDTEATARSIRDGWFYTGDLGRLDTGGNLYFVGRMKQVIRRRGENISAFEVEEVILLHPDILECAAYGVPSDLSEEDIKLSIVRRANSTLTEQDVHDFAMKSMARFQVPRYIEFIDALPRTTTGKVEVFRLQDMWNSGDRSAVHDFST